MMNQRWGFDRNVLRPTPGDPWGVEQHHWNTGTKENQQLNPGGPSNRQKKLRPKPTKINSFMSGPSLSLMPDPPPRNSASRIKSPARHDLYVDFWLKLQTNKQTNLASFCNWTSRFESSPEAQLRSQVTLDMAHRQGVKVTFLWVVSTCTQLRAGGVNLIIDP